MDWLLWSKEAAAIMTDYWKTIDTVLMGRKTYVFSRTLAEGSDGDVAIIRRDAAEFVRDL